jgi:hypothetical protein
MEIYVLNTGTLQSPSTEIEYIIDEDIEENRKKQSKIFLNRKIILMYSKKIERLQKRNKRKYCFPQPNTDEYFKTWLDLKIFNSKQGV